MSKQTIVPFGPQHPVLPEPIHLDLVLEDETVVEALPQVGFVHRGLEQLVSKKDFTQFVYITERICGICSFGHSLGYTQTVENLMGIEVPPRAEFIRVILHELSRVHSHILWLGLAADAFGFESLFMQCWRLRERILDIFERTTGGRVILSAVNVGGINSDIPADELAHIVKVIEEMRADYDEVRNVFVNDMTVQNRLSDVGRLTKEDALELSVVGPFARASGVAEDVRMQGFGGYGYLDGFEPVLSDGCDCLARVDVRTREVIQSFDIIEELISKIPDGEIQTKVKTKPEEGAQAIARLEQPRGECVYYAKGNGTKFLERFRIRTPTAENIAGLVQALQGCQLADVPNIILTIDPCISCMER